MLTIGISTRNRLEALVRCVQSIALIFELVNEIIVIDDASDVSIEEPLRRRLGQDFFLALKVIREEENIGYVAARNSIVNAARSDFILNLDDDAFIIEAQSIKQALELMCRDNMIAAIAFAQADKFGNLLPEHMQPTPAEYICYVPCFIGFAHMLRRDIFLSLGGYRNCFFHMGEEKEYCLRLLHAGYSVIYLPAAKVAHMHDTAGRVPQKGLRYVVRNNCLGSMYNEPWPLVVLSIPVHLYRYFKMKRGFQIEDPGGFVWILNQLRLNLRNVWLERRPVSWRTIKHWRKLRRSWPPYFDSRMLR